MANQSNTLTFEDLFEVEFYKKIILHPGDEPYTPNFHINYEIEYPTIKDYHDIKLKYYCVNKTLSQSLFTLRSTIRYWCDLMKTTSLFIYTSHDNKNLDNGMLIQLEAETRLLIGDAIFYEALHLEINDEPKYVNILLCNGNKINHKKNLVDRKALHLDLIRSAWHPNRCVDWCFDEDEKSLLAEITE